LVVAHDCNPVYHGDCTIPVPASGTLPPLCVLVEEATPSGAWRRGGETRIDLAALLSGLPEIHGWYSLRGAAHHEVRPRRPPATPAHT
jgi:hypothetical protein